MSIEALWAVQFTGSIGSRSQTSGGVVVFETGRIFGGDTWMWYTGTYQRRDGGIYDITMHNGVHHTAGGQSIFGQPLQPRDYTGTATVSADQRTIQAKLTVVGSPQLVLTATLTRVAELP